MNTTTPQRFTIWERLTGVPRKRATDAYFEAERQRMKYEGIIGYDQCLEPIYAPGRDPYAAINPINGHDDPDTCWYCGRSGDRPVV